MWKASLLLAAVGADFDDAMVAAGQRGQRKAHKAGPALLDVLRVPVRTGCALTLCGRQPHADVPRRAAHKLRPTEAGLRRASES